MDKQEFLLLIPGVIFGVVIVDLLNIFRHKKPYWEMVLWGVYMFLVVIFGWSTMFQKLESITHSNKNFFLIIFQSIVYAQAIAILTPGEQDTDTKAYFLAEKKMFFLAAGAIALINIIIQYTVYDDHQIPWLRPLAIVGVLLAAFIDKVWVRTSVWAVFFALAIYVLFFNPNPT